MDDFPRYKNDLIPVLPLKNRGSTSGSADIDVTNMSIIECDTALTVYWEGNSSAIFNIVENKPYGVVGIKTLHVSVATNYIWI